MRRVILQNFVTLDGFAADSEGVFDFAPEEQRIDEDLLRLSESIDTVLLGRKTYELFAQFWPTVGVDTEIVADFVNRTPKVVFSRTLGRAPWGDEAEAQIARGPVEEELAKLKVQPGRDMILWGSLELGHAFMQAGLIDEVQLRLCPVVLGTGRRLWPEKKLPFKLMETKPYPSGTVLLRYHPGDT